MEIDLGQIWRDYDLSGVSQELDQLFPDYNFSLEKMLEQILKGDILGAVQEVAESVSMGIGGWWEGLKGVLIWLLVVGIAAAVLSHFIEIFNNHQIADISFYFVYLLLMTVLFECFEEVAAITSSTIENVISFIKIFVPAYLLSVGVATGTSTVTAYYGLLVLIIYLIQSLMLAVVIPAIYCYVLLAALNGIWMEEKLTMLVELLEKGIRLVLKLSIGAVFGVSMLQSLIAPVIDSAKATVIQKAASAIPGIGNVTDGVVDIVLGSAIIIKNSLGVVILILLLAVSAVPLLKIFIISAMLKIAAALLGIVSDKRVTQCTARVGNGGTLLLQTAGTAVFLFFLTLSVAALTTNRGF